MRKHLFIAGLIVILILSAFACGHTADRYTLITLLHTNDLHGRILTDTGGLARIATKIREIRREMPNVILLDAGDTFLATYIEYYSGGRATISAMNAIGYDAAVVGNHEFDFGADNFRRLVAAAHFPFLSANLKSSSGDQFADTKPYVILNVSGVRVAVLGLGQNITSGHWASHVRGVVDTDPIAAAKELVLELKKQADVVVMLSHLGVDVDRNLARTIPGIDFIIGGHTHTTISKWEWVNDTLIAQTGFYAQALGRVDFIVKTGDKGSKVVSVNGKSGVWSKNTPLGKHYPSGPLITLDASITPDKAVMDAYEPFRKEGNRQFSTEIGKAMEPVPGKIDGSIECATGDLIADAVRESLNADVAIVDNSILTTAAWKPGPLHIVSVFSLIWGYTEHYIVEGKMRGADLLASLQQTLAQRKTIPYYFSGITLTYQIKDGAPEIVEAKIGGAPLDLNRAYTIATQAFTMAALRNSFPVQIVSEPSFTTREAVTNYVKSHGFISAPKMSRSKEVH